jgi:hypothetical protein
MGVYSWPISLGLSHSRIKVLFYAIVVEHFLDG